MKKYHLFSQGIYDRHKTIKPVLLTERTSMKKLYDYTRMLFSYKSHIPSFHRFKEVLKENGSHVIITKWPVGSRSMNRITYTW